MLFCTLLGLTFIVFSFGAYGLFTVYLIGGGLFIVYFFPAFKFNVGFYSALF